MSEQVVHSTVAWRIIFKFLTKENVTSADTLTSLRAQFGDSVKNQRVWLEQVIWRRSDRGWKHAKTTHSAEKVTVSFFWDSLQGVLFVDFLIEWRTINASYYSKLLKDRVKADFRSERRGRSVKSVCLLHDNACPHTAALRRICIGRYCHTPQVVLTWRQDVYTYTFHSKRP